MKAFSQEAYDYLMGRVSYEEAERRTKIKEACVNDVQNEIGRAARVLENNEKTLGRKK